MIIHHYSTETLRYVGAFDLFDDDAEAHLALPGYVLVGPDGLSPGPDQEIFRDGEGWGVRGAGIVWAVPASAPRQEVILSRLRAIDAEAARPLRAIALAVSKGDQPAAADLEKAEALEAEAESLREELRSIV